MGRNGEPRKAMLDGVLPAVDAAARRRRDRELLRRLKELQGESGHRLGGGMVRAGLRLGVGLVKSLAAPFAGFWRRGCLDSALLKAFWGITTGILVLVCVGFVLSGLLFVLSGDVAGGAAMAALFGWPFALSAFSYSRKTWRSRRKAGPQDRLTGYS